MPCYCHGNIKYKVPTIGTLSDVHDHLLNIQSPQSDLHEQLKSAKKEAKESTEKANKAEKV